MHLIAYLKAGIGDLDAEAAAARAGVIARAISPLYRRAPPRQGLILGFSGYAPTAMAPAAARLGRALAGLAPHPLTPAKAGTQPIAQR